MENYVNASGRFTYLSYSKLLLIHVMVKRHTAVLWDFLVTLIYFDVSVIRYTPKVSQLAPAKNHGTKTVDLCLPARLSKKIGGQRSRLSGALNRSTPQRKRLKFYSLHLHGVQVLKSLSAIEVWLHQPWWNRSRNGKSCDESAWDIMRTDDFLDVFHQNWSDDNMNHMKHQRFSAQRLWPNNYTVCC